MLSPARPSSRSLRNISTPVQTVLVVSLIPTISISSLTFTIPRSTRPVTTVPRPVIENTSSIGIRNGLSTSRTGSVMNESTASMSSTIFPAHSASPSRAFKRRHPHDRGVVTGELVLVEQLADLELHQLEDLLVVDHVGLVQRHHDARHTDLTGQQHVLTRLGHRTVRRRDHQDRTVHLRRTRDHVLDVVGVTRAVDVRVVPVLGLVLHMRDRDRDPALLLLRRLVDLVERREVRVRVLLRQHLRDRRGQRRLPMVDVTDRADVEVRLRPLELLLGHGEAVPFVMCCRVGTRYSPRTLAVISSAIDLGTSWYESNCIVYVARPWVRDRRSVA